MIRKKGGEMRQEGRKSSQGSWDTMLFLLFVGLTLFGVVMVFSASAPYAMREYGDPQYFFYRDLIFSAMGIVLMLVFSRIDYRVYRKKAGLLYILAILSCLLVFLPGIGNPLNNAHRWIRLGPFTYMPSDGLKVASLCFLAAKLSERPLVENGQWKRFLFVMAFIGFSILPVFIQPNFSAVVVIAVSLMFLYFIGGMSFRHLIPMVILAAIGLVYAFYPRTGNYRLDRLLIVLDPMRDPQNTGWQLLQSLYSVASGGLFGVGFGKSSQKFGYLADEPHNDFIFAVISEELGFIAAVLLLLAFAFLAYRGLRAASRAKTTFGRLFGYGLTFLISFQAMVNIGVSIGVIPTTGITLPFISYGGSSLLVMSVVAGILLNISRDNDEKPRLLKTVAKEIRRERRREEANHGEI